MRDQLKVWESDFGADNKDRNKVDWRARAAVFQKMLAGLPISCVLEIGCNRGYNLIALTEVLGPESDVVGIEPNQDARETARALSPKITALRGK